jgi:hypothetical protein
MEQETLEMEVRRGFLPADLSVPVNPRVNISLIVGIMAGLLAGGLLWLALVGGLGGATAPVAAGDQGPTEASRLLPSFSPERSLTTTPPFRWEAGSGPPATETLKDNRPVLVVASALVLALSCLAALTKMRNDAPRSPKLRVSAGQTPLNLDRLRSNLL